eukprot:1654941-Prymnesium_polylepis.1
MARGLSSEREDARGRRSDTTPCLLRRAAVRPSLCRTDALPAQGGRRRRRRGRPPGTPRAGGPRRPFQ